MEDPYGTMYFTIIFFLFDTAIFWVQTSEIKNVYKNVKGFL